VLGDDDALRIDLIEQREALGLKRAAGIVFMTRF